jgi:ComF family protein
MGDGRCHACRDYPPEFERAVAYGEYRAGLRELIHLLKYDGVLPAARPLGEFVAAAIKTLRLPADRILILPVPLHSSKRRERGFNQSERIARAARKWLPANFELCTGALVRHRVTQSQVGLDREARIANMQGAFRAQLQDAVAGHTVLLLDDVMTTGTTLSECAGVLNQAGARRVFAATVARTLKAQVSSEFSYGEGERAEAAEPASV